MTKTTRANQSDLLARRRAMMKETSAEYWARVIAERAAEHKAHKISMCNKCTKLDEVKR